MTDQELMREYVGGGSERAFQTLVDRHLNLVYSTALRHVTNAGLAQEVTQHVFIALARKAAFLARDVPLAAWLHRTAVLEARHHLRAELRRKRREATAVEIGTTMKEDDSLLKSLGPVLDEALMDLREKDRQALLLRFCENKSLREVGQSLGVAEDAAQKRVASALDRLTRVFRGRGYGVSAVSVTAAALQSAVATAPAGLASAVGQAALQHAGAISLGTVGLFLAKLMSLTKAQTAALCLVAAAIPVTYEWSNHRQLRREQAALQTKLAAERDNLTAREAELDNVARRLRAVENQVAAGLPAPAFAAAATTDTDPSIYLWSEESKYIHVPKTLLKDLGLPAIDREIRLSQLIADTLSLQPDELARVNDTLANFKSAFAVLEATHATPSEKHIQWFHPRNNGPMRSFLVTPFAEEGRQLMTQLQGDLGQIIGPERAQLLWPHAEASLRQKLSEVGAEERLLTVYVHANSAPRFYEAIQRGNHLIRGQGIHSSDREPPGFLKAAAEELQRDPQ